MTTVQHLLERYSFSPSHIESIIPDQFIGLASTYPFIYDTRAQTQTSIHDLFERLNIRPMAHAEIGMGTYMYGAVDDSLIYAYQSQPTHLHHLYVVVAGRDPTHTLILRDRLKQQMPVARPTQHTIPFSFWMSTRTGISRRMRRLFVPDWDSIRINYTGRVVSHVDQLMSLTPYTHNSSGKRLILAHGSPGSGKTFLLRALCKAWAPWCSAYYITDPEKFFNDASYMYDVLTQQEDDDDAIPKAGSDQDIEVEDVGGRWRLLILEDTDEILRTDSKVQVGQALSRLLNMTDGILGQGMNQFVVITTNEPIDKLHPALIRPGRCLANIQFSELTVSECHAWCAQHHINYPHAQGSLLRDLYNLTSDVKRIGDESEKKPMGFKR